MIVLEISFQDLTVSLGSQSMKYLAEPGTDVSVVPTLSHLWDENDMILAVPL
jgi:hypothetical protein